MVCDSGKRSGKAAQISTKEAVFKGPFIGAENGGGAGGMSPQRCCRSPPTGAWTRGERRLVSQGLQRAKDLGYARASAEFRENG